MKKTRLHICCAMIPGDVIDPGPTTRVDGEVEYYLDRFGEECVCDREGRPRNVTRKPDY